ncbi:MAG: tRNA guanosine(34) transglycosylase Tgt, partial [Patescibacteria group bacterium]
MFELIKQNGKARRGRFTTAHGVTETPFFMPIATKGAVKTLSSSDMEKLGASILLSNTYHLLLRPGFEGIKKLGGLHKLMNWNKPILTDSGGYQVFSLSGAKMSAGAARLPVGQGSASGGNKTTEEGVKFQSHIDGAKIFLTPELSMEMQKAIGSDIAMQFDDVASGVSTRERYEEAMERSLRWGARSKDAFMSLRGGQQTDEAISPHEKIASSSMTTPRNDNGKLFGIVQGGTH